MTDALTALFEGKEVRAIEQNGEVWFPLIDLTDMWGLHRNTLRDMIKRNEKKFQGFVSTCAHVTCAGQVAVNEPGLYLLMGAVNTSRLKNPQAAEVILRFQRWVPKLIQQYRKKEIVQAPANQDEQIKSELSRASLIAQETGGDPRAFQRVALEKLGLGEYAKALDTLPPAIIHGEPGEWMNPTDIGYECALTAQQVNYWLLNHEFQIRDGPLWRLTPKGMDYGEEYVFEATSKHSEIRIRWHRSVLIASGLKRSQAETQIALPAKV